MAQIQTIDLLAPAKTLPEGAFSLDTEKAEDELFDVYLKEKPLFQESPRELGDDEPRILTSSITLAATTAKMADDFAGELSLEQPVPFSPGEESDLVQEVEAGRTFDEKRPLILDEKDENQGSTALLASLHFIHKVPEKSAYGNGEKELLQDEGAAYIHTNPDQPASDSGALLQDLVREAVDFKVTADKGEEVQESELSETEFSGVLLQGNVDPIAPAPTKIGSPTQVFENLRKPIEQAAETNTIKQDIMAQEQEVLHQSAGLEKINESILKAIGGQIPVDDFKHGESLEQSAHQDLGVVTLFNPKKASTSDEENGLSLSLLQAQNSDQDSSAQQSLAEQDSLLPMIFAADNPIRIDPNHVAADALLLPGITDAAGRNQMQPFAEMGLSQLPVASEIIIPQVTSALKMSFSQEGIDHLKLTLNPVTLGKVEVELNISELGHLQMVVMASEPNTLDLLQRESETLRQALQEAGYALDQGGMRFELSQGNSDARQFMLPLELQDESNLHSADAIESVQEEQQNPMRDPTRLLDERA